MDDVTRLTFCRNMEIGLGGDIMEVILVILRRNDKRLKYKKAVTVKVERRWMQCL